MIVQLRNWMELCYFISGIVVAIAVVYGLKQIALLKKDIHLRNDRAAKEKAIEYGRRYLRDYVDLSRPFEQEFQGASLGPYFGPIGDFTSESIHQHPDASAMARKRYALPSWLPAMNELEAISASFTTGVADEATGFKIFGRSFCKSVELNYDLISLSRDRGQSAQGYWANIVKLYKMWAPRLEEVELRQAKEHLDSRIATVSAQSAPLPPIGAE